MMDTKTLVVGQEVLMVNGVYSCKGKVVEVMPEGVEVRATEQSCLTLTGDLLHFDNNGRSYIPDLPCSRDSTAALPSNPWDWDGNGTFEGGPWQLVNPSEGAMTAMNMEINDGVIVDELPVDNKLFTIGPIKGSAVAPTMIGNKLFTLGSCTYSPIEGSAVAATIIYGKEAYKAYGLVVGQKVRVRCEKATPVVTTPEVTSTSGVVTRITVQDIDVEIQIPNSIPCMMRFDHFGSYCDNNQIEGPRTWYIVKEGEGDK